MNKTHYLPSHDVDPILYLVFVIMLLVVSVLVVHVLSLERKIKNLQKDIKEMDGWDNLYNFHPFKKAK